MKNMILLMVLSLIGSTVSAGECSSSVCRQPVRNTVSVVRDTVSTVVKAPVRATRKVADNIQARRYSRRCH